MKMRLRIAPSPAVLLALVMVVSGCNIFSFSNDAEKPPMEKAEDAIRDGNYAKARNILAPAVKDSTDSMALYLNAKTALLESGVDLATLVDLIEGEEDLANGDNLAILSTIDKMSDTDKTAWYRTNMEIRSNLGNIWKKKTVGLMKKEDISLGYTVSNMMSGVLGLRDTNRDGVINAADFQIDLAFIQNIGTSQAEGFNLAGAKIKDENGIIIEDMKFEGLTVFLGDWQEKPGISAKTAANKYQPDDINPLIAFVLSLLDEGADSILFLFSDKDLTTYDVDAIKKQIDEVAAIINYYWYDDNVDNDGDGRVDEEQINGIDDDGDGLEDEDSNYHPSDPTNQANTQFVPLWRSWSNR